MSSYTVAILGRPNVGKSTFFNRLLEERKAIVDDISGVTRDRQYGVTEWNGKTFNVIDTGGFVPDSEDIFETEIRKQVRIAIDEANAIVFMVDAAVGLTDLDDERSKFNPFSLFNGWRMISLASYLKGNKNCNTPSSFEWAIANEA